MFWRTKTSPNKKCPGCGYVQILDNGVLGAIDGKFGWVQCKNAFCEGFIHLQTNEFREADGVPSGEFMKNFPPPNRTYEEPKPRPLTLDDIDAASSNC